MENQIVVTRLKGMLTNDKKENPIKLENVIKSEILYVLKNYMDIKSEDVDFAINVDNDGKYEISLYLKIDRLKLVNYIV